MEQQRKRSHAIAEEFKQAQVDASKRIPSTYPPIRPPAVTNPTTSKGEGAPIFDVNPEKEIRKLLGL